MNGWIKIHRSMMDWEWYGHPDMVTLWIHLLLSANLTDGDWRGVQIKRGQLVTGRRELSRKTGLSERTIRTCLSRLQSTHEVTIKATNKYSIITICKFDSYQVYAPTNDPQTDQQSVQQTTTNKEYKKKEERNISREEMRTRLENETLNNGLWVNQTSMALHSTDILQIGMEVLNEWDLTGMELERYDKQHLFNHIRKKIEISKKQPRQTAAEAKNEWRAKMLQSIQNDLMYGNTPK